MLGAAATPPGADALGLCPPVGLPRFHLVGGPTPLYELSRLRTALGGARNCPRILVKRDDLAGPALGGNKARKLEYVVADAVAHNATHLITVGAVQSNHARITAAAARLAGLSCVLVLSTAEPDPRPQGNLLLDRLFGAEVHLVQPAPDLASANPDEEACITRIVDRLQREGHRPYVIPIGGSTPLGALGYVNAVRELQRQLTELGVAPTRVYFGAGSRGTQAGIVLGRILHGATWVPHGVAVSPGDPEKTARAVGLVAAAAGLLGREVDCTAHDIITHQEYWGSAYGVPTPEGDDAIRLLAKTEAILVDPVYTAKAMAGLLDHVAKRTVGADETVVFIHTGGVPGIFSHADRLAASYS